MKLTFGAFGAVPEAISGTAALTQFGRSNERQERWRMLVTQKRASHSERFECHCQSDWHPMIGFRSASERRPHRFACFAPVSPHLDDSLHSRNCFNLLNKQPNNQTTQLNDFVKRSSFGWSCKAKIWCSLRSPAAAYDAAKWKKQKKQKRNNSTQLLSNNTPKRGTASLSSAHLRVDSNGSLECSLKSLHIQTANLIELGPE